MTKAEEAGWNYFIETYGIDNIAISEDIKRAFKAGVKHEKEEFLSKITKEHIEGLRWIIHSGITTQPIPYHKYCKDLLKLLESYKNEI